MSRSSVGMAEELPLFLLCPCMMDGDGGLVEVEAFVLIADMAELAASAELEYCAVMLVVSVLIDGAGGVGVNDVKEGARAVCFLCSLEESLDLTEGVREVSVLMVAVSQSSGK